MPTSRNRKTNSINYSGRTPIKDYLENVNQRNNRLWTLRNGKLVTNFNGEEMEAKDFDLIYPVASPISFNQPRESIDSTKSYLL